MQMYRVKFARKLPDDMVDLGDTLVCANSQEAAGIVVAHVLEVSVSQLEMHISRVKPSFYQLSRRAIKKCITTNGGDVVAAHFASNATFPGTTENRLEEAWFAVEAKANIRAENENAAIFKLSEAIAREMAGEKQRGSCKELDILCDRAEFHPRSPAVEQNALYSFHRIFQGGDART